MRTRLLVSLSGIGRHNLADCVAFAAALDRRGVPLSLLLTPKPGSEHRPRPGDLARALRTQAAPGGVAGATTYDPVCGRPGALPGTTWAAKPARDIPGTRPAHDSPVLDWIRTRERAGDALVLHGFDHSARPSGDRLPLPRLAPATSWAGGGRIWRRAEFADLPAHEAGLRLLGAVAVLERLDLATTCFAPPSWLASPGTLVALRRRGFEVCADALGVHELGSGRLHRGRVYEVGRGELWARAALRAVRRGGLVRLAVKAGELSRPQALRGVLGTVGAALRLGASGGTYADFGLGRPAERRGLNAG
ncbi:DUF2334 domain-containing protein [Crossiella equi]|uniref:DUF2334 domain-containing protein n=1 Tax=Crossiella equi TaxID=130796 RepID=UPI000A3881B1|nr:DUF2334 domain-containing protein [Crossiella equi]